MSYREILGVVRGYGFDQIARFKKYGYDAAYIGRKEGNLIPFTFPQKEVLLPNGDETELEDEEIDSILRWIEWQSGKIRGH